MILQNHGLPIPQRFRDPLPLLPIQYDSSKVIIDSMAAPESQRVLRHHVQLPTKDGEGLAVDGVGVAGGVDVGAGLVDLRVDGEGGGVDGLVALDDLAVFVDEDQV
jgi:hypothetical protein